VSVTRPHPLGLTEPDFIHHYAGIRLGPATVYRSIFKAGDTATLPAPIALAARHDSDSPEGPVTKFLLNVACAKPTGDATLQTESVLIPMVGRKRELSYTLCVSSQVGCAMGCTFCETAQMGLIRSLEPWEIVAQWFAATHVLKQRPRNIVFMGMGEPMDNLDAVIQAIAVLTDHAGAAQSMSKIVVSTVGRIDGIARLGEHIHKPGWHRLGLALSLNAPNDEIRSKIMPVNRGMPMAELRRALQTWPIYGGSKICLEYVLIPGVNDAESHAKELASFASGLPVCVNIIPYNPRRNSPWPAPTEDSVNRFLGWLIDQGTYCKRRRTKGRDTMAACGQLGNEHIRQRKLVTLTTSRATL
jgi:23S rRNA (adenine2503-C2)-methyltransferase